MTAGLVASVYGDAAADLAATGIYDSAVVTNGVAAGETAVLGAQAAYSARTTLVKNGEGTLVLPASAFEGGLPARVQVAAGKVVYTNDLAGAASAPADLSAAVKAKLAFWGSVKDATHLAMEGAGIEKMFDLREADTNAPAHLYLEAEHFDGAAAPTLREAEILRHYSTVTNKRTMAWFGGYGSGISMKFLQPNGTAYTRRPLETAAVYGYGSGEFGFLFGNCKDTTEHTLWNEGNALPWNSAWGPVSGDTASWIDGEETDRNAGATLPWGGFHTLQVRYNTLNADCGSENLNWFENAIFSIRATAVGKGGQYVGELMFFTNRLTDVERSEVQAYLANKWELVNHTPARVELAAGTTLEADVPAGETETANLLVTGKGTLVKKGAGTLHYRPEAREATTPVKVDLQAGDIVSSGALTLKAAPGMKVTASPHDGAAYTGARISVGSAAQANVIEKDGNGYAAIDSIPAGTRRVLVKGGTLAIRSNADTPARYEVAIPNGRFEDWGSYTGRGNIGVNTVGGAWSAGGSVGFYHYDNWTREGGGAYYGATVRIDQFGFDKYPPPEGQCVLMLKVCNCWAEVAVPFAEGGEYELRFLLAGRSGSNKSRMNVILRGADNVEYEIGKAYLKAYNVWTPQTFRFRVPSAGTHRIRFFHLPWLQNNGSTQQDYTLLVNGLHLYRVGDGGAGWKLPFGDCETTNITSIGTQIQHLSDVTVNPAIDAIIPGWTFDQTIEGTYTRAGLASTDTYCEAGRRYGCAFNGSHAPLAGERDICIRRTGGWARTVFTPPAGRWRLRAHSAWWGENSSTPNQLLASLAMGDDNVDLGAITLPFEWQMRQRSWPNAFTADGATPVTLTVTSSCDTGLKGGAFLDNFELVAADDEDDDGELVKNGDFESPRIANGGSPAARTGWSEVSTVVYNETTKKNDTWAYCAKREYGRNDPDAFGLDHGSGDVFVATECNSKPSKAGFYQDLTFPRAGAYRLTYLCKGRAYGGLIPHYVYLVDTANSVTNQIDGSDHPTRGVYEQRSAIFRVNGPCTRRLLFMGDGTKNIGYVCFDDVSVRRVREEATPVFGVGASGRLSVNVSAGARLHLDYIGTNTVTGFTADGLGYDWGVIDQSNCPAIIGSGALLVKPHSLKLIFR